MIHKIQKTLLALLMMALVLPLSAGVITIEEAIPTAKLLFAEKTGQVTNTIYKNANTVEVAEYHTRYSDDGEPYFHLFNMAPTGFIILAADDEYEPVIGFSDNSSLVLDETQLPHFWNELKKHEASIQAIRDYSIKRPTIKEQWAKIKKSSKTGVLPSANYKSNDDSGIVVGPLTTSIWNQDTFYNAQCPSNALSDTTGPDGKTYAGCMTLAMTQLMYYHQHAEGNGSISYEDEGGFGTQSVDFCNTEYNFEAMADSLNDYNDDLAQLIYHSAVSLQTSFSTTYTSAYFSRLRNALVYFFGYDPAAEWFYDSSDPALTYFPFYAKQNLDQGNPVILAGTCFNANGTTCGAHAWVCDGYGNLQSPFETETAEYYHFNWGWGGYCNGWFKDSAFVWETFANQANATSVYYYHERYVLINAYPSEGCAAPVHFPGMGDQVRVSGTTETSTYLNVENQAPFTEPISFRYRQSGNTDWIETPTSNTYFSLITDLFPGTEYEFQARRDCCDQGWSDYSSTFLFTTEGELCASIDVSDLNPDINPETGSGYLYGPDNFTNLNKQFRYRQLGGDWTLSEASTSYFAFVSDLTPGNYEFQVRVVCSDAGDWTLYSESAYFQVGDVGAATFRFNANLLLEGAYDSNGLMNTGLRDGNLIPNQHPFGAAPYFYTSTEAIDGNIPMTMVDWILIEARVGTPNVSGEQGTFTLETQLGLLMSDGSILGVDKNPGVAFYTLDDQTEYYFCIRHRNHLDILTSTAIAAQELMYYDFTNTANKAFGAEQLKSMDDGYYALYAGDFNKDGVIQTTDYDIWQSEPAINNTYNATDANLDGVVQATDFDAWFPNKAKVGSIEISF